MLIAYFGSDPSGSIEVIGESEAIKKMMDRQSFLWGHRCDITTEGGITELPSKIAHFLPDILHLTSHGVDGKLEFFDDLKERTTKFATANDIFQMVEAGRCHLRLIFLNGCNTAKLAERLSTLGAADYIVGCCGKPDNATAVACAKLFYASYLSGKSPGKSLKLMRAVSASRLADQYLLFAARPAHGRATTLVKNLLFRNRSLLAVLLSSIALALLQAAFCYTLNIAILSSPPKGIFWDFWGSGCVTAALSAIWVRANDPSADLARVALNMLVLLMASVVIGSINASLMGINADGALNIDWRWQSPFYMFSVAATYFLADFCCRPFGKPHA